MRRLWICPCWADWLLLRGARPVLLKRSGMEACDRCGIASLDVEPHVPFAARLFDSLLPCSATVYLTDESASKVYAVDLRRSAVSVWTPFALVFGWLVRFRKEVTS